MSKKKSEMILGYTRAGHEVLLPRQRSFGMKQFVSWTRGDHIDASRILREHGEREQDPEIGPWCTRWARAHRAIGRGTKKARMSVRGAAEISIKIRGPR